MIRAHFAFYPDLNEFLQAERRSGDFDYAFEPGQSIKHLAEAAGVPHTEVGRITVDGVPVDFNYLVRAGDAVAVFRANAQNAPLRIAPRFVLDNHLGRLAAYLRMLGFDTLYRNDYSDETLAAISTAEERILLTRDRRLLMRKIVQVGYCLRSLDSHRQLEEVVLRYDLVGKITPFRRCLLCNGLLKDVSKEAVLDRLQPLTRQYYEEFHLCPDCSQIYWKGTHFERMEEMIARLRSTRLPQQEPGGGL
ncbi:MAG TPA: Mut7-C RNAse domain-containing protein [Anaerolineaceae bacterium]